MTFHSNLVTANNTLDQGVMEDQHNFQGLLGVKVRLIHIQGSFLVNIQSDQAVRNTKISAQKLIL
jgi:hypothetical protein